MSVVFDRDGAQAPQKVNSALMEVAKQSRVVWQSEDKLQQDIDALKARCQAAVADGATVSQIAEVSGLPVSTIDQWCPLPEPTP